VRQLPPGLAGHQRATAEVDCSQAKPRRPSAICYPSSSARRAKSRAEASVAPSSSALASTGRHQASPTPKSRRQDDRSAGQTYSGMQGDVAPRSVQEHLDLARRRARTKDNPFFATQARPRGTPFARRIPGGSEGGPVFLDKKAPGLLFARLAQCFGGPTKPVVCSELCGSLGRHLIREPRAIHPRAPACLGGRGLRFGKGSGNPYAFFYLQDNRWALRLRLRSA